VTFEELREAAANASPKVQQLARGIARAEGFGVAGALPTRCNNPGDLELGDLGLGMDRSKTVFPDTETGWAALYHECGLMLAGLNGQHRSAVYDRDMKFLTVAQIWTGGDNWQPWASIVASACGMLPSETLADFLNAMPPIARSA